MSLIMLLRAIGLNIPLTRGKGREKELKVIYFIFRIENREQARVIELLRKEGVYQRNKNSKLGLITFVHDK